MMGTATAFRTPEEAALELDLPLLGTLPKPADSPEPVVPVLPVDETTRAAYRRTAERILSTPGFPGSVGVIGDVVSARRARVAGAMAAVFAQDREVVLVDADVRAAHLSFDAGARAQEGLVDVLRYGVRSPRVVAPTATPGVDLLPVGSGTVDLAGTYRSDACRPLIEELGRGAKLLLLNGPDTRDVEVSEPLLGLLKSWVLVLEIGVSDVDATRALRDTLGMSVCAGVVALIDEQGNPAAKAEPAERVPAAKAEPVPPAAPPPVRASARAPRPLTDLPPTPPLPRTKVGVRATPVTTQAPAPTPTVVRTPPREPERAEPAPRSGGVGRVVGIVAAGVAVAAIAFFLLRPGGEAESAATRSVTPDAVAPPAGEPAGTVARLPVPDGAVPEGEPAAPATASVAASPVQQVAEQAEPTEQAVPAEQGGAPAGGDLPPSRREGSVSAFDLVVPVDSGAPLFGVHVSSFRDEASAREEAARFLAAGFPTVLHETEVPGKGRWVRVYVGPFASGGVAGDIAARIRESVQDYALVRHLTAGELRDGMGREDR